MDKKYFSIFLVMVVAVLVAVGVITKQSQSPLIKGQIEQQTKMLEIVERLDRNINNGGSDSSLSAKIDQLEKRMAALEEKVKNNAPAAKRQGPPPEDYTTVHDIPVGDSYVLGNKDAKVTIVEFVDFECPFCARFHPPIINAMKEFPDDVNFIIKNFPLPFHPNAKPASKAAMAAGEQGKYFEMADLILKSGRALSEAKYIEFATQLGLKVDKFKKDLAENDARYESIITADMELVRKVGVNGTPTMFINGKKTPARQLADWKQAIERELKAAN